MLLRNENFEGSASPSWRSKRSKGSERASILTGVPVFIRPASKPSSTSCSVMPCEALSPALPPSALLRPMCISPPRNVPAVRITDLALNSTPIWVRTPTTSTPPLVWAVSRWFTESCQRRRLGVFSKTSRQRAEKRALSHCALGLHIAAPFERLSIRNCMVLRSVITPIWPPRASISLTI